MPTLGVALLFSLMLIPAVRWAGVRLGMVAQPRADRWHRGIVPYSGGVAVFAASAAALFIIQPEAARAHWGLLAGAAFMFGVGLWDDLRALSPPAKLAAQIMAAAVVVFSGYRTGFFDSDFPNLLVTVVWLVGITNAINLLDNMDGLAGGISLIAAGFISYFFALNPLEESLLYVSLALCGAILGFLIFNFPPAKIFMGDSGSLFIGFTLAALAIARTPQASNVFAVMGVPALLFILPILDTLFVTFTRLLRGQSPVQGGRDHTSHRLVAFGLSERQTVLLLYGIAIISGAVGAIVERLDYTLSLVLIPVLLVSFALLAAYLSRLKVVEGGTDAPFAAFLFELTYRRHLLEIALDFFLVSIAYYLAWWARQGFAPAAGIESLTRTLPLALGAAYAAFALFGVYRGVWRYTSLPDLLRIGRAALAAAALGAAFLFAVFLFFALAVSRSSFKLLDQFFNRRAPPPAGENVLIYDAGDTGEMTLRWLRQNPELGYRAVGFLDDDPLNWGRDIHGLGVLGGSGGGGISSRGEAVHGVVVVPGKESDPRLRQLEALCQREGWWLRAVRIKFEPL
jgi:UDP-GlcNAc:undecaprenyl-phosphate GlcNAc-1-phosphate transferase